MKTPPPGLPSPCISVCRMHAGTGWCEGCLRTLDEIAAWSLLDEDAKRLVWRQLHLRRAAQATQATPTTTLAQPDTHR